MRKLMLMGKAHICTLAVTILFTLAASAQPTSQTFNTSGNYTIPAGYSANVTIEAWGAGGGGSTNLSGARGGGGGGAYASLTTTLGPGTYAVSVGTGGGVGVNGGPSSFTTIVIAAGGSASTGTTGGAGGTVAASTGGSKVAGTDGSAVSGNNGGSGGAGANGGAGGGGGIANNGSAGTATAPGGGGGGKAGPGGGGLGSSGANGRVIVTVNVVLAVKYSSIRAYEKAGGVEIEWATFEENNLSEFVIERSFDGNNYTRIGNVIARNNGSNIYNFLDLTSGNTVVFYRLRAVDVNGKASYSNILKFGLGRLASDLSVYPNPVTNRNVSFQSANIERGTYSVRVFNSASEQVYAKQFNHNGGVISQTISLPPYLKAGVYTIQVGNESRVSPGKIFTLQ